MIKSCRSENRCDCKNKPAVFYSFPQKNSEKECFSSLESSVTQKLFAFLHKSTGTG
jgi:hypothetical protein